MRSKLFVPGSRPELFPKALASEADGLSIDLEDAVTESRKTEARATVGAWLRTLDARHGKTIIVRVNAMDTPHFEEDVAAVVQPGLDVINLPKPASPEAVRAAVAAIERAEKTSRVKTPVRLLLNIETPLALRTAAELALSHERVMGLQLGLGDLFEPLDITRRNEAVVQQVLLAVRMAAGEAGIAAFDSAFADVKDAAYFIAEAQMARRLGYTGKSCIHPSQVALANQAFRPTDAEIAHSLRVVAAARDNESNGMGAYLVDGKMVDRPFVLRARAIVSAAERLGLLPPMTPQITPPKK